MHKKLVGISSGREGGITER